MSLFSLSWLSYDTFKIGSSILNLMINDYDILLSTLVIPYICLFNNWNALFDLFILLYEYLYFILSDSSGSSTTLAIHI